MKKYISTILATVTALMMTSCVDLDLKPLSEGSSGNWYSTPEECEMSLYNFYTDAMFPILSPGYADDMALRGSLNLMNNGSLTAENGTIATYWENFYKGISRAIRLINNLEEKGTELGLTAAQIKQYESEAYFYMGYAYGQLSFYWGDAILNKTGMTLEEGYHATRSPHKDVLAFSYECFDKAIDGLPLSYTGIQRATKGAAMAFKARTALYNGDWAVAAEAAKACMDLDVYKLHPSYRQLFLDRYSDELIFYFCGDVTLKKYYYICKNNANDYLPRVMGGWGTNGPSLDLVCAYPCTDGLPIDESPLYDPQDLWANRDPRMAQTIVPFATYKVKNSGNYNPADYAWFGIEHSPDPTCVKVAKIGVVDSNGNQAYQSNTDSKARAEHAPYNGFIWKKFIDESWLENGRAGAPTTYPYLRYADVLLMYAEALNEMGKLTQDAIDASINKIRERAYNGTGMDYPKMKLGTQAQNRKVIRTERFIELAHEGHRYPDLLRWRIAEKIFNTPVYYLPRAWSGFGNWDGDLSKVKNETFKQLCKNWEEGNYPIGGVPKIDENGMPDLSEMVEKGWIVKAVERKFTAPRDYLWPVPAKDILVNPELDQNPGW